MTFENSYNVWEYWWLGPCQTNLSTGFLITFSHSTDVTVFQLYWIGVIYQHYYNNAVKIV